MTLAMMIDDVTTDDVTAGDVATDDVTIGGQAAVLDRVAQSDCALAIWDRGSSPALAGALAMLDLDTIDDVALDLATDAPVDDVLHAAGYPDTAIAPIAADIGLLVRHHAALTGSGRLALRLEVVETDACRRFHADYGTLRLLCSYIGPATQWHRIATPDLIHQVPTGAAAVFKGRLLLDPPTVLHRSPPIAARGGRRLMLVLDPA
jgi:hypothetical protein